MPSYLAILVHCYKKLKEFKWKRMSDMCYEEKYIFYVKDYEDDDDNKVYPIYEDDYNANPDMYIKVKQAKSFFWEAKIPIEDVVETMIHKARDSTLWKTLTRNANTFKNVIEQGLKRFKFDDDFPMLTLSKDTRSFRNGILLLLRDGSKFIPYTADASEFVKYGLNNDMTTAKFYNLEFDSFATFCHDPYDIPTPFFQSILDNQGYNKQSSRVFYGMIGRLLHEYGKYDNWMVVPFMLGLARTGKSVIGKIIREMFRESEIATLSSNMQQDFGLEKIDGKSVWLCFETDKNWNLSTTDFLTMVGGDPMTINRKNKVAKSLDKWTVPGMCMGNERPDWKDRAGNYIRRVMFMPFKHKISDKKSDADMEYKIKRLELGLLIAKCHNCYVYMLNKVADQDIWTFVPKMYTDEKEKMAKAMNPIKAYLESDKFERGPINVKDNNSREPFRIFKDDLMTDMKSYFERNKNVVIDDESVENEVNNVALVWKKGTHSYQVNDGFSSTSRFKTGVYIYGIRFASSYDVDGYNGASPIQIQSRESGKKRRRSSNREEKNYRQKLSFLVY